jgi:dTMP kinase
VSKGLFITFEGTEGCGKSTQVKLLTERLRALGHPVRTLREPGGTPIGEEIRHTLKHSKNNEAMTAEAELLLMNASRAQLVREIIQPALAAGEMVLCDRFYDSTTAYQGFGRGLDLEKVRAIIGFAVGKTKPDLTLLLHGSVRARKICRSSATASRRPTGHFLNASRKATPSSPPRSPGASSSSTARNPLKTSAPPSGSRSSRCCRALGAGEFVCRIGLAG